MSDSVLVHVDAGVATLTLNRPEQLNAFGGDMRERLAAAIDAVATRADVRVLAITGAGRAFCAGGDVKHMVALKERRASFDELRPLLDAGRAVIERLDALAIPTIAAVNGAAAGAGLHLALACDLRVASDQAVFAASFVKIGLHPDWGGTWYLPRKVGLSRALEMCWLGDPVGADEALRIGLVNRAWPQAGFESQWRALAARLAAAPVASVRLAKRSLRASEHGSLAASFDTECAAQEACWASPDSEEGLRAFVEKRAPAFGAAAPATARRAAGQRFE